MGPTLILRVSGPGAPGYFDPCTTTLKNELDASPTSPRGRNSIGPGNYNIMDVFNIE